MVMPAYRRAIMSLSLLHAAHILEGDYLGRMNVVLSLDTQFQTYVRLVMMSKQLTYLCQPDPHTLFLSSFLIHSPIAAYISFFLLSML